MDRVVTPGRINGTLNPPSSKSYAQRALAAALLCPGVSRLGNIELCDDTKAALRTIEALGATLHPIDSSTIEIKGGFAPHSSQISVGESGLSTRLFTPIAALSSTPIRIDGYGSLLSRPMHMMIAPLESAGVIVKHNNGHLPFEVCGPLRGGTIEVDGSLSSQFITGLLLALPTAAQDTILRVNNPVSLPYIDMTIDTLSRFGVEISHQNYTEFYIKALQEYQPVSFDIEGDWSSASTLLVAGALAGSVELTNLSTLSKQADRAIVEALIASGAQVESTDKSVKVTAATLHPFDFDATQSPDLFPALVALAAACNGTSHIKGVKRLAHKESNRAQTLQSEYAKVGITIDINGDEMTIHSGKIHSATVTSHNDHRIAMSLATVALIADGPITIENSGSVSKSYPLFFEDLESLKK